MEKNYKAEKKSVGSVSYKSGNKNLLCRRVGLRKHKFSDRCNRTKTFDDDVKQNPANKAYLMLFNFI